MLTTAFDKLLKMYGLQNKVVIFDENAFVKNTNNNESIDFITNLNLLTHLDAIPYTPPYSHEFKIKDLFNPLLYIKYPLIKYLIRKSVYEMQKHGGYNKTDKEMLEKQTNEYIEMENKFGYGYMLNKIDNTSPIPNYNSHRRKVYNHFLLELKCYILMYRYRFV